MKYLILTLTTLFLISCQKKEEFTFAGIKPSEIDSLKTEAQIEAYIHATDTTLKEFELKDYSLVRTFQFPGLDSINSIYAKKLGVTKTFYKEDFNNDGYTDILVTGGWKMSNKDIGPFHFDALVILNGGKAKATITSIQKDFNYAFVPQTKKTDSLPLLILHYPQRYDTIYPPRPDSVQIKLIYKSGSFVEYMKKPAKRHAIEKIEFSTGDCESCPVFQMILNNTGDSWFIALENNFEKIKRKEGCFKTRIDKTAFEDLSSLLNYIDFENLREDYCIFNTGPPHAVFKITYDGGKIKYIYDCGGGGTYGLTAAYEKIKQLRFTQEWKSIKEPNGIRLSMPEMRTRWKRD